MALYNFICAEHGRFEKSMPMADAVSEIACPECGELSHRDWQGDHGNLAWIPYCDGFHVTDYGKRQHKQDALARAYELETGEKAPEPAKDAPRNYKRKA